MKYLNILQNSVYFCKILQKNKFLVVRAGCQQTGRADPEGATVRFYKSILDQRKSELGIIIKGQSAKI